MSMGEIIIILIVAVLVLGPEKLPSTAVQIAKILKALKRQVDDAKESIEKEIRVSEIKKEADKYKNEFSEYNQNIRKKLSFEEFDELKKEIVADTNAIKEDINAIEKDLASLGGGEKSENVSDEKKDENLSDKKNGENLSDLSEKIPQNSPQNSAIVSANDSLKENEPHKILAQNSNKDTKNLTPQPPQKDKKSNKSTKNSANLAKNSKATNSSENLKATTKNSKVVAKNSNPNTKKSASAKTSTAKNSKSKVENV